MRLYGSTALLGLVTLLQLTRSAEGNTPPTLSMDRDWRLSEDEPVGAVVTRITSHDKDGDHITYGITKGSVGEDGSKLFTIDEHGVVKLAASLKGMGGRTFYVSVAATDGQINTRTDARVLIRSHSGKSTHGGLLEALNPNSSPFAVPNPSRVRIPFTNPFPARHLPPPPPHPQFGGNGVSQGSPPLLALPTPPSWIIRSTADINALVAKVSALDLTNDSFFFTLKDEEGLVAIDPQTGEVTVKKSLRNKVGNHRVLVEVTNRHGTADGEVFLQVLPGADGLTERRDGPTGPPVIPPQGVADSNNSDENATTDVGSPFIAIIKNGPTPPPTTTSLPRGSPGSTGGSEHPQESPGPSVIIVLLIVGSAGTAMIGPICWFCCCRKKNSRKGKKESSVSYGKKGLELSPASSAASSLTRQETLQSLPQSLPQVLRFWDRRASDNKYEDGQTPPALPSRSLSSKDSYNGSNKAADKWEIPRYKLKFLSNLGEGCFGQVWKCEATELNGPGTGKSFVAVKTLKESAGPPERKDLQQELKVLKMLGNHPNVLSLLACCTEKEPTLVVLEYLVNGKLQSYLRDRRCKEPYNNLHGTSSSLSPRDLTIFALQVAKGMDYLCCHGIVHRDLAARNVLVGEDKVCKVADFGFARDVANNHVYERKSDGRLPIRWMAVESLFDNIFTSKTDVWSFGILLWEIVTLGSTPYPGMSAEEVMAKIKIGYRLEKPNYCKREVYNIMYYCWYEDHRERPTFKELIKLLEGLITSEVDYIELNNFPDRSYYNIRILPASGELL